MGSIFDMQERILKPTILKSKEKRRATTRLLILYLIGGINLNNGENHCRCGMHRGGLCDVHPFNLDLREVYLLLYHAFCDVGFDDNCRDASLIFELLAFFSVPLYVNEIIFA